MMSVAETALLPPIDRVAPTRRPAGFALMRQRWARLGFLHWEVPAAQLRRLVPAALEIDTFAGRAYVGLVPFTITGVRLPGLPALPWISRFHEINVRTYVHRAGRDPGVWFFSLDAARALAVIGARTSYRLPYHHARMRLDELATDTGLRLHHQSERLWPGPRPARSEISYLPCGPVAYAAPDTLEHFLAERYILYAASRRGHLFTARVHHAPYPLQPARVEAFSESLLAASGVLRPATAPLAHYASEVEVEVYPLRRVG